MDHIKRNGAKMRRMILEVCVDSVTSALAAEQGGADRIELCSNLIIGGTTPDPNLFRLVKEQTKLKIHVLIRPRFGDFCYDEYECEIIKRDIEMFRDLGADGVVIGALLPDGSLNEEVMKGFMSSAEGMQVTFHRAFDVCKNPTQVMEQLINLGVDSILTSGQENDCLTGMNHIKQYIDYANYRIDILVGSGVNAEAIYEIYKNTGAVSFHMSGKKVCDSNMIYRKQNVSMGVASISEYERFETDSKLVKRAKEMENMLENISESELQHSDIESIVNTLEK